MKREKQILDTIYHNLRLVNIGEDPKCQAAVMCIAQHLTNPDGNYNALLQYLDYYGKKFLAPRVCDIARNLFADKTIIVEFGAGTGWFGGMIADKLNAKYIPTDKRPWSSSTLTIDLETELGVEKSNFEGRSEVLVVMVDLLHCISPAWRNRLYENLRKVDFIVAEYSPKSPTQRASYNKQIEAKGCFRFSPNELGLWVRTARDIRVGQYLVVTHKKEG